MISPRIHESKEVFLKKMESAKKKRVWRVCLKEEDQENLKMILVYNIMCVYIHTTHIYNTYTHTHTGGA